MITKPMSAGTLESLDDLQFNGQYYLATPKLDGRRALIIDSKLVSRAFKPIRNVYTAYVLECVLPECSDGEICVGKNFQDSGAITRIEGRPAFTFYWFDWVGDSLLEKYSSRIDNAFQYYKQQLVGKNADFWRRHVTVLRPTKITSLKQFKEFEKQVLDDGYEGVCLRLPSSPYKCGEATAKSQWLLKWKRFKDGEAIIIGFYELKINKNKAQKDNFGRTVRSSSKDGKILGNTLGGFKVKEIKTGVEFKIGSGFTQVLRKEIWDNQNLWIGKIAKYKHFAQSGVKNKPRHAVYLGLRDKDDM